MSSLQYNICVERNPLPQVNLHQAVRHAAQLNLKDKCPHSGTRPWPAFATEEEIQAAAEKTKRLKLVVHKPQNKRVRAGPIWSPVPSPPKSHGESRPQSAPASAPAVSPPLSKMIKEQPPPDLWQVQAYHFLALVILRVILMANKALQDPSTVCTDTSSTISSRALEHQLFN